MFKLNKYISNLFSNNKHFIKNSKANNLLNSASILLRQNFCTQSNSDVDLESIAKGDEKILHKLKVLQLEAEVMRQEGRLVPEESFLKTYHWQEILKLETFSSRRRYYEFLFKISKTKENRQCKKEQKKLEREQNKPEAKKVDTIEELALTYGLQYNNLFLRFYDSTMNQMYNNRLIQQIQFGQKLVVDCGYDHQMTNRENRNCSKQLVLLFSDNRNHDQPFDLHFCNSNPDSLLIQSLLRYIPQLYEGWFPLNMHSDSYLNHFPKEKLVYLTPHCREELIEYDHDAVYIIGGIVDMVNNNPLSLAKAKEEGLKMAKLPLDRYLQWGAGSGKSLTLNQMISILLDIKQTNDWKYALRHVPKRKILDEEQTAEAQKRKQNKLSWTPSSNMKFTEVDLTNKFRKIKDLNVSKKRLVNIKKII